jgi:hypothetical protein
MSARGLYPMTKATIRLTAMGSMSGALTNYLLGILVMKGGNPIPPTAKDQFKQVSEKTIDNVMEIVGEKSCGLTKAELSSLEELADSYKEIFKLAG